MPSENTKSAPSSWNTVEKNDLLSLHPLLKEHPFLKEQSGQGLYCFHSIYVSWRYYCIVKQNCSNLQDN